MEIVKAITTNLFASPHRGRMSSETTVVDGDDGAEASGGLIAPLEPVNEPTRHAFRSVVDDAVESRIVLLDLRHVQVIKAERGIDSTWQGCFGLDMSFHCPRGGLVWHVNIIKLLFLPRISFAGTVSFEHPPSP